MRPHWTSLGLKSNDWCPYGKRRGHTEAQERRLCEYRGRGHSEAVTNQGTPKNFRSHQKLGRTMEGFFPGGFRESIALPTP